MTVQAIARAQRRPGGAAPSRHLTRTADLAISFSFALDAAAARPVGHGMRTCFLAMRLAEALEVPDRDRASLFYAALLHEAGEVAPSQGHERLAALRRLMPHRGTQEERRAAEHGRVRRGAQLVLRAGFDHQVAVTIMSLRERWDGRGLPLALAAEAIPLFARIVAVAKGLDDAATDAGPRGAETLLHARSGTDYDPELVGVMLALCGGGLLEEWAGDGLEETVRDLEPSWLMRMADEDDARRIGEALTA
ncbi:MAG: HD domain-containing protein [Chloroflexota bacterium]|nr:HD domain-containing protein [Chloroflexota bacterium]